MAERKRNVEASSRVTAADRIPIWNAASYELRRKILHYTFNFLTLIGILIILFPLYWTFATSLKPGRMLANRPASLILLPSMVSFEHYIDIVYNTDFLLFYFNSMVYAGGVVIVTTIASTLGGYGLTRIEFPHKKSFARLILFGYMFPAILLAIPMFIFWRSIGFVNTYIGLILAISAVALPFSLWLMWKFFQTVPIALEESARMCGASRFRAFFQIALPLAKPGVAAVAVFSYAVAWNAYTIPLILAPAQEMRPLTVGINQFRVFTRIEWGQIMAASALTIIPAFIFVYWLQKYMLKGFAVTES